MTPVDAAVVARHSQPAGGRQPGRGCVASAPAPVSLLVVIAAARDPLDLDCAAAGGRAASRVQLAVRLLQLWQEVPFIFIL